jgi:MoxR-like ATPase
LEPGDIVFIDEIHRMQRTVEEYLYSAMEDFVIDIMIDQGPNARSVRLELPRFTLVGATTRSGLISAPLRSRFGLQNRLDYYSCDELAAIVTRSAGRLNVSIDAEGAHQIAARSRGTPRIANNLLRRVRDYAQVRADNHISGEVADKALSLLEIDPQGLDEMDIRILEAITVKFNGGPVGLGTIAVAVGEEPDTVEEAVSLAQFLEDVCKADHPYDVGRLKATFRSSTSFWVIWTIFPIAPELMMECAVDSMTSRRSKACSKLLPVTMTHSLSAITAGVISLNSAAVFSGWVYSSPYGIRFTSRSRI